jgi:ribosomal protein L4
VADYIRQRFISTAEAGTSEANLINSASFQKFVRDNRRTLEQVLDKDQVNAMQALADDLNRSARSTTGSALRACSMRRVARSGRGLRVAPDVGGVCW